MTSLLDNLDCSSDSDDIHRLFPKCRRPISINNGGNTRDINLNTLHDDNDNRMMMLGVMQQTDSNSTLQSLTSGNGVQSPPAPPSPAPTASPPTVTNELLMDTSSSLNVNGLSISAAERRGADADDEDEEDEEDDEDRDESVGGSQGGGDSSSPLAVHEQDVQNGTSGYSRKYNKHLRDSRIEIAGGREVFSQSKSKAARKRYSEDNLGAVAAAAAAVGTVGSIVGPSARRNFEDSKVGVWEVRGDGSNGGTSGRGEQLKKVRNVPAPAEQPTVPVAPAEMVTETVFSTEVRSIRRLSDARYRMQASGVSSTNAASSTAPVVYEVPMSGVTEVVVFDDIGECLAEQHLRSHLSAGGRHVLQDDDSVSAGSSSTGRDTPPTFHRPPADFFRVLGPSGSDADTDALSPERSRAPRVIGGLPIAEYEGSPRRYGPRPPESPSSAAPLLHTGSSSSVPGLPSAQSLLSSPSVFPPRPGFPQRVVQQQAPPQEEQRPETPPPPPPPPSQQQQTQPGTDPGAYDYLYEFSETRKVLEEFFKPSSPPASIHKTTHTAESCDFHELDYNLHRQAGNSYVGQRLAKDGASPGATAESRVEEAPLPPPSSPPLLRLQQHSSKTGGTPDLISLRDHEDSLVGGEHLSPGRVAAVATSQQHPTFLTVPDQELLHDAASNVAEEDLAETEVGLQVGHSRNFTLSPETTDCDSNDIESEVSLENEGSMHSSGGGRLYSSMPVLEDGLSSGHASDSEDVPASSLQPDANPTVLLMKKQICEIEREIRSRAHKHDSSSAVMLSSTSATATTTPVQPALDFRAVEDFLRGHDVSFSSAAADLDSLGGHQDTPPPPAPQPHRSTEQQTVNSADLQTVSPETVEAAIKDIRMALQRTKALPLRSPPAIQEPLTTDEVCSSPVWVPRYEPPTRHSPPPVQTCGGITGGRGSPPLSRRHQPPPPPQPPPPLEQSSQQQQSQNVVRSSSVTAVPPTAVDIERKSLPGPSSDDAADEEELDTDLETDRLLGQQRTDDQGFFDDKEWRRPKLRGVLQSKNSAITRHQPPPSSLNTSAVSNQSNVSSATATTAVTSPTDNANNTDKSPSPQKNTTAPSVNKTKKDKDGTKKKGRNKEALLRDPSVLIEGVLFRARYLGSTQLVCEGQPTKTTRMMQAEEAVSRIKANQNCSPNSQGYGMVEDEDDMEESEEEIGPVEGAGGRSVKVQGAEPAARGGRVVAQADDMLDMEEHEMDEEMIEEEEDDDDDDDDQDDLDDEELDEDTVGQGINSRVREELVKAEKPVAAATAIKVVAPLSSGSCGATAFRLHFLGSVEVEEEGKKHRKRLKKNMVEEAVSRVKAPEGENQPSTEVDLFISTEKIMVLNTDLKEIMMDHALRTISYIADIGDLVVLMARRRYVPQDVEEAPKINRTPKMICHVFESDEAQFIAQSIGQAFQVAYMEFLKANGIEDHSFVKEMDYQEVLNSQEIFGDELQMFAKKEMQKEVVVPKAKGEILGVVIVESGWGSMLPTVVIANLAPAGAAARCGQLNIGDQIIAINGVSLVGLPLSTCQNYIKNTKNQTVVKLTVVPCAPVVEVKIKRPDTKYQLGFSVQNGVICSLLRGGIAERGGVRVGHRIIEINNQSVVAVPHEKIVNLLATSVGEILMKTMPTSMFRLLTGQETPVYI